MWVLNGQTFKTKKSVLDKVKEIKRVNLFDLVEVVGNDGLFLLDLMKYHPDWEIKRWKRTNIPVFQTVEANGVRSRCFGLMNGSGRFSDFSQTKCLSSQVNYRSDFLNCCRLALSWKFKETNFKDGLTKCENCGLVLRRGSVHVDHDWGHAQFVDLVDLFIVKNKVDLSTAMDFKTKSVIGQKFANSKLERKWLKFHKKRAKLRFLCRKCNGRLKRC